MRLDTRARLAYLGERARGFDLASVWRRATEAGRQHRVPTARVFADMLRYAVLHDTAFNDYVELDFAMLTPAERRTFMTSSLSNHIARTFDDEAKGELFLDKLRFNETFDAELGREWIDIRTAGVSGLAAFGRRHSVIVAKIPDGQAGKGVERYELDGVRDWDALHAELLGKGQLLVEEHLRQHPEVAKYCPGTANTMRINAFFDGEDVHLLSWAQKFGRGAVSDQPVSGGFYTMLDDAGRAVGDGHTGASARRFPTHPDTGEVIRDFQVPMVDEVRALIDRVARVVPEVPYVGWDVVVAEDGPVVVEGNWVPGLYEHKPSVTGIRIGTRARFERAIGA